MKDKKNIFIITGFLLLSFVLVSGCGIKRYSMEAGRFMKGSYVKALRNGQYNKAVNGLLSDIEEGKRKKDYILWTESAIDLNSIYLYILKDYSKAIQYGGIAFDLTSEVVDAGNAGNIQELITSHDPVRIARWVQIQRTNISGNLYYLYTFVGNHKKADFYKKEADRSSREWEKFLAEDKKKEIEKKKLYLEKVRAKYPNDKNKILRAENSLEKAQRNLILEEKEMAFLNQMEEMVGSANLKGARATMEDYLEFIYRPDIPVEWQEDSSKEWIECHYDLREKAKNYFCAADIAYYYGLYREAYDFCVKSLNCHEEYLKCYVQYNQERLGRQAAIENVKAHYNYDLVWFTAGKALNRLGRYNEAVKYLQKAYDYVFNPQTFFGKWQKGQSKKAVLGIISYSRAHFEVKHKALLTQMSYKMELLYETALAYEGTGKYREAANNLIKIIDHFEGIRSRLVKETEKIGFMTRQQEIYEQIIDNLLKADLPEEALAYVERSKSRAFVDLLGGKTLISKSKKAHALLAKIDSIEKKAGSERLFAKSKFQGERGIQVVEAEMAGVFNEIKREDAELLSMTSVQTLKAGEIQALLEDDTALIEYYVKQDSLYIWVITVDSIKFKKVDVPVWILANKIVDFREKITGSLSSIGSGRSMFDLSRIRLDISPRNFKNGDEHNIRVYVKNNIPLFLSINALENRVGEYGRPTQELFEREVSPVSEKIIMDKVSTSKIVPGNHQVILHTDQGKLVSNIISVTVDKNNMVKVKDKGGDNYKINRSTARKYNNLTLHDLLIKPVESYLNKKRIGILAHGILHYLPFSALENNKGRYLVEDYSLFYLPSATVYRFCLEKVKNYKDSILALGNPDLGKAELNLDFAHKEVEKVSSLYPKSEILLKNDASEAAFKSLADSYNVIHLACHGIFDPELPLDSALLLTPSDKEDGKLTVNEIFDLQLKSGLVTLSACQSGISRIKKGDELMGFPRAFIYAGSPTVVASLWNVSDEATAYLMEQFYKNLKETDKAEALRKAQLDMIQDPKYKSPFLWAAFYLIGSFK